MKRILFFFFIRNDIALRSNFKYRRKFYTFDLSRIAETGMRVENIFLLCILRVPNHGNVRCSLEKTKFRIAAEPRFLFIFPPCLCSAVPAVAGLKLALPCSLYTLYQAGLWYVAPCGWNVEKKEDRRNRRKRNEKKKENNVLFRYLLKFFFTFFFCFLCDSNELVF